MLLLIHYNLVFSRTLSKCNHIILPHMILGDLLLSHNITVWIHQAVACLKSSILLLPRVRFALLFLPLRSKVIYWIGKFNFKKKNLTFYPYKFLSQHCFAVLQSFGVLFFILLYFLFFSFSKAYLVQNYPPCSFYSVQFSGFQYIHNAMLLSLASTS